jgi:maleate isomerase
MYGERGKIGLIVPSNNTVVEQEFRRMLPEGICSYATRMRNTSVDMEDLRAMVSHATRGAGELANAEMNVIAFACTAGSLLLGTEWERDLRTRLEAAAGGIPCLTTSQSVIEAFGVLGVRRVVVATPYSNEINRAEVAFFEANGIEVVAISGLGILRAVDIGKCPPREALEMALALPYKDADGIFISCTNFRTIEILSELEQRTGKPAFSSNVATLWGALRRLPHPCAPLEGFGRLLTASLVPA